MGSLLSIIWFWSQHTASRPHTIITDYDAARSFLRNSTLEDRAAANGLLAQAFQIFNPFTTPNHGVHAGFKVEVDIIMRRVATDWTHVHCVARKALLRTINHLDRCAPDASDGIPVEALIRTTTMLVVCEVILGVMIEDDLVPVAMDTGKLVQSLWTAMKKEPNFLEDTNQRESTAMHCRNQLFAVLPRLFPDGTDYYPSPLRQLELNATAVVDTLAVSLPSTVDPNVIISNPLNILIPTYETLYRVLIHAFLQLRMSNYQFASSPSTRGSLADETLVEEIESRLPFVHEVLRLYPPVKRIHRADADVDIATIHRDTRIFGSTAGQFDPHRLNSPTLLTFSAGPHQCPAGGSNKFAEKLVASILHALEEGTSGWEIVDERGVLCGEVLPNERGAFEEVKLKRVV